MHGIPYMQIRGGSSKGLYFLAKDLPENEQERDQLLLDIVGRDHRQIDGLGGAHPLTSKVAIVCLSDDPLADVDYLFAQVVLGENRVDTSPNCGNILSGVGAFALESGLISAAEETTTVRVKMLNSHHYCDLILETPNATLTYQGDTKIDGVPGTASPVMCQYKDVAGSVCGVLLPTGNTVDVFNGVPTTCIDNGMPVVVIQAKDVGCTGYESVEALNQDSELKSKLEAIRLLAGKAMNLGDVTNKVVPKMSLVSKPISGGHIHTRTFIPHTCHTAIGVLGAVSVATACMLTSSVAQPVTPLSLSQSVNTISVEHPTGEFSVELSSDEDGHINQVGLVRTARVLSKGIAYPAPY
ncbi:4-oxalomesaconate tautomerase [Vibrio penaeicida]|uniref:4-oxalomesaconate tautomerase n=2 Tax=Vibrio penaeicida TaxID=104609 RepID=A0AAV5NWR3_9VIBR|nr:4-oxalomesaconate tautomerase [Vibrio penaeicida]RTZ24453.1 4-oxalomesaconate tautomerase [Vibrio penaeicida]GLQ74742.1 hypothetical protein GCM10007932_41040 [Vibrio penaeicida]